MKKTVILMMAAILTLSMALVGCGGKKTEEEKLEENLQSQLAELEEQYDAENKTESDKTTTTESEPESYDVDFFGDIESHVEYFGEDGSAYARVIFNGESSYQAGDYTLKHVGTMNANYLQVIYQNKKLGNIFFQCDTPDAVLKAGDNITVKCGLDQSIINRFEEDNLTYRKQQIYTVPSLGTYVTSASQLTAANIEELKNSAYEAIRTGAYESATLDSIYFGTAKQGADTNGVQYIVIALYSCVGGSITKPVSYPYVSAENIISNNGTLKYAFSRHNGPLLGESAAVTLESISDNYTFEKIG